MWKKNGGTAIFLVSQHFSQRPRRVLLIPGCCFPELTHREQVESPGSPSHLTPETQQSLLNGHGAFAYSSTRAAAVRRGYNVERGETPPPRTSPPLSFLIPARAAACSSTLQEPFKTTFIFPFRKKKTKGRLWWKVLTIAVSAESGGERGPFRLER